VWETFHASDAEDAVLQRGVSGEGASEAIGA